MTANFPTIDLFAGPGGLGEGFSTFRDSRGNRPFHIAMSIEKEASAFETLRLRSFLRQFEADFPKQYYDFLNSEQQEPDWEKLYPQQWAAACQEVVRLELGSAAARRIIRPRLDAIRAQALGNAIVIGGPPCQAYSLVGRARNRGINGYQARDDRRHFLYREYIDVLRRLQPAVFVMENVKGMISSTVDGKRIFDLVLADLKNAGGNRDSYRLLALAPNSHGEMKVVAPTEYRSFVVRAEEFGVPQARHRVILIGVRSDIVFHVADRRKFAARPQLQIARHLLEGMPRLRSGLSRKDSSNGWTEQVSLCLARIVRLAKSDPKLSDISKRASELRREFKKTKTTLHRSRPCRPRVGVRCNSKLKSWILDPKLRVAPNNQTRSHMKADLIRYMFAAIFGQVRGRTPKSSDFPNSLSPAHLNWKTGKFSDRFRVQLYNRPSSTITSHISKDGHYFIHPDPLQCRSLTVREAARLQTFPDNYFFKGNRTQQYVQVGNAVPPYLAYQIASVVHELVGYPVRVEHRTNYVQRVAANA